MNNKRGNRLSEHSFANAVDVGGFRLADGSIITVLKGWKGGLEEQNFLREIHAGACRNFATVLGPGADAFHYDHFHMDLARHGRRGDRSICRPYPQPVSPPNQGFPFDPSKGVMTSDSRSVLPPVAGGTAYAASTQRTGAALPQYRPSQLPGMPRNPIAEQEAQALSQAPARQTVPIDPKDSRKPAEPVLLYGKGQGPFLPLPETEIDPEDLDPVTGSIGE
jgi:Extensin-like protein C-terminus